MYKTLKWIRILFGVILFLLITASFLSIGNIIPKEVLQTQFVPSLLHLFSGGLIAFVLILILTLLFGRVYCSFLCPLGIYQDVVTRVSNLFKPKKKRKNRYIKSYNALRYTILGIVFVSLILGITYPLALLDPYSNWGRIVAQIFNPVIQFITNLLSNLFPGKFYFKPYIDITALSLIYSLLIFLTVTLMAALKGRLFCNTICPVGSLFGLISKTSLYKVRIDKDRCKGCNLCVSKCKGGCIDVETKSVDESRCVACLNCMNECSFGAIEYKMAWGKSREKVRIQEIDLSEDDPGKVENWVENRGRREALATIGALGATVAVRGFSRKDAPTQETHISGIVPPGGESIIHLKSHCTGCHACIAACPNKIIKPALLEYGLTGFMLPVIKYNSHFCAYDCNECTKVCPNGALKKLTLEEKKVTQIGRVRFRPKNCIIAIEGTSCGACDEHCPTKAISMSATMHGKPFPSVNPEICIGCGGCEYICPTSPKAMVVIPNPIHLTAVEPTIEKQEKIKVDDFGF